MIKNGMINCNDGVLSWAYSKQIQQAGKPPTFLTSTHIFLVTPLDNTYEQYEVSSEYFFENTGDNVAVQLLGNFVDFGHCSRFKMIESRYIRVANRTKGKMSCVWVTPGENQG